MRDIERTFYDGRIIHACARVPNYPSYIATMVQIELAAPSSNPTFRNFAHKLFSIQVQLEHLFAILLKYDKLQISDLSYFERYCKKDVSNSYWSKHKLTYI